MVRLNKNGGPKNPEKVDRLCALFTVTNMFEMFRSKREEAAPPVAQSENHERCLLNNQSHKKTHRCQ